MRKLTFLFFFLTIITSSSGQKINPITNLKHFGENEGLTSKTVYLVIQDKEGFIWIATDAGVFRYDGRTFKHFTVNDGITDNEVLNIYQDKQNRIWFMTLNGYLSYWHNGKMHNPENTQFLNEAYLGVSIAKCYEDSKGNIWFGGIKSGWIKLNSKNQVEKFQWPQSQRDFVHYYIYEDLKGNIWYFFKNKMIRLDRTDSVTFLDKEAANFGCYTKKKSEFIYGSTGGIFRMYDGKLNQIIDSSELKVSSKIITMRVENNELWIGTQGDGCFLIRDKKIVNHYLSSNSVSSSLTDREGNIWFSTLSEGVYVLYNNSGSVTNYNTTSGLSENKIFSITGDNKGSIWVGYKNGVVERIKNNTIKRYQLILPDGPTFNRITSLLYLNDTVWCGTDQCIFYIVNENVTPVKCTRAEGNGYYAIKQIINDNDDNIYSVFSFNFLKRSTINKEIIMETTIDSISRIFSAIALGNNSFLISSMTGINKFSPGRYYEKLVTDTDISHNRFLDMKADNDGLILLASNNNGLFILDKNKIIQHFSTQNGFLDNNCRSIFINNKIAFISTANGIEVLKKKNNKWNLSDAITMKSGILSNSINEIFIDSDQIYVATDNGLSIILKEHSEKPKFISQVIPTEIITDKNYVVNSDHYLFNTGIKRLLIKFSYPVYNPLNKMPLKYRLILNDNETQEWTPTGDNEVEFSSFTPGKYIIQLAPDIGILENSKTTNIYIEIKPLWWQTLTAKILYALVLSGFSIFIILYLLKKQYEKRLRDLKQVTNLEAERNRIATDMHDDIGGDLTQISIWSNILNSKIQDERGIVSKVASLSNEVLQKMDQIIWALNSIHNKTSNLISYLHSYALEYLESSEIRLIFEINDKIPDLTIGASHRRNIFLAVKELLHNTVKHSEANIVTINISLINKRLIIDYSDNGKGITEETKGTGLGMTTLEKRLNEINSFINFNSTQKTGFSARLNIDIHYQIK